MSGVDGVEVLLDMARLFPLLQMLTVSPYNSVVSAKLFEAIMTSKLLPGHYWTLDSHNIRIDTRLVILEDQEIGTCLYCQDIWRCWNRGVTGLRQNDSATRDAEGVFNGIQLHLLRLSKLPTLSKLLQGGYWPLDDHY